MIGSAIEPAMAEDQGLRLVNRDHSGLFGARNDDQLGLHR
jgi:hypothetical protein